MLKNGFIADIPLIFAAIDPCICCAERTVTLVSARSGEESIVRMSDLRRQALARVNRELGAMVVIITHNSAIAAMADRVIRLSDGRIAGIDTNAVKLSPRALSW